MRAKTFNRITWIDMAKGYGMLLVIWAHLIDDGSQRWIYSFHMPLFFFLSGYVFNPKYNFFSFVKRKCKANIIPYFLLGIPMIIFEMLRNWRHGVFSWESCQSLIISFIKQERLWTLWFIACLFWVNIIFYIMVKFIKSELLLLCVSGVMTIMGLLYYENGGVALPWNVDVCLMAMPFFCVGYCYKLHHEVIEEILAKRSNAVILFVVALALNLICGEMTWRISEAGLEMFYSSYGCPPFTYIAAFAGTFCVIILAKQWTFLPIRYIGEHSMLYYAWHQTIMIPIAIKLLALFHVDALANYGFWGIVLYKLGCMIIIVGFTTICNEAFLWLKVKNKIGKSVNSIIFML